MMFLLRSDLPSDETTCKAIDVSIAISSYLPSVFRSVYRLASPSSFDYIIEETYFFLYPPLKLCGWTIIVQQPEVH